MHLPIGFSSPISRFSDTRERRWGYCPLFSTKNLSQFLERKLVAWCNSRSWIGRNTSLKASFFRRLVSWERVDLGCSGTHKARKLLISDAGGFFHCVIQFHQNFQQFRVFAADPFDWDCRYRYQTFSSSTFWRFFVLNLSEPCLFKRTNKFFWISIHKAVFLRYWRWVSHLVPQVVDSTNEIRKQQYSVKSSIPEHRQD